MCGLNTHKHSHIRIQTYPNIEVDLKLSFPSEYVIHTINIMPSVCVSCVLCKLALFTYSFSIPEKQLFFIILPICTHIPRVHQIHGIQCTTYSYTSIYDLCLSEQFISIQTVIIFINGSYVGFVPICRMHGVQCYRQYKLGIASKVVGHIYYITRKHTVYTS